MTRLIVLVAVTLGGCSTVESRLEEPPLFNTMTSASIVSLQGCISTATAKENVSYLPTATGGLFKSTAGPQSYVFWTVSIDDLGDRRRVTVHAVNGRTGRVLIRRIAHCIS